MNNDSTLFKAAFYADLDTIKSLVQSKDDLIIKILVKDGDYKLYWDNDYFQISILDILNWAYYGFYEYIEQDNICSKLFNAKNELVKNDCINPQEYYYKVINCIEWICNKFSICNYQIKDYSQYRLLRHFLLDDENYLRGEFVDIALKEGYKQIDLDLINEAEKGNGIKCYELIKKGANHTIDPLDFSDESLIIDLLGSENSHEMLSLISYLSTESEYEYNKAYDMLSSLYNVGVGNYILDIVI